MKRTVFGVIIASLLLTSCGIFSKNEFSFSEDIVKVKSLKYAISDSKLTENDGLYIGHHKGDIFYASDEGIYVKNDRRDAMIYSINEEVNAYSFYMLKNYLLVIEYNDNDSYFDIFKISFDDYDDVTFSGKYDSVSMPTIYVCADSDIFYLGYTVKEDGVSEFDPYQHYIDQIEWVNYELDTVRPFMSLSYSMDELGNLYGRRILNFGGNNKELFCQIVNGNGKRLEECDKAKVFCYQYDDKYVVENDALVITQISSYDIEGILLHVSGTTHHDKRYILLSRYGYEKPLNSSGELMVMGSKEYKIEIEGIESGEDITNSRIMDNKILLKSPSYVFVYDLEKNLYNKVEAKNIVLEAGGASYLTFNDNEVILNVITMED